MLKPKSVTLWVEQVVFSLNQLKDLQYICLSSYKGNQPLSVMSGDQHSYLSRYITDLLLILVADDTLDKYPGIFDLTWQFHTVTWSCNVLCGLMSSHSDQLRPFSPNTCLFAMRRKLKTIPNISQVFSIEVKTLKRKEIERWAWCVTPRRRWGMRGWRSGSCWLAKQLHSCSSRNPQPPPN